MKLISLSIQTFAIFDFSFFLGGGGGVKGLKRYVLTMYSGKVLKQDIMMIFVDEPLFPPSPSPLSLLPAYPLGRNLDS